MANLYSMPSPCDKGTLHFKGKDIDAFLATYEYYAAHMNLTMIERCNFIHLYFSKKEKELLDILEGYRHQDWNQLKQELQSLYTSSSIPDSVQFSLKKSKSKVPDSEIRSLRTDHNPLFESATPSIPECPSLSRLCKMCRESYHNIRECQETKFLILLGICYLDMHSRVFMTNGSALPQAEGEGGIACVIRDCEADHTSTPAHTSESSPMYSEIKGTTPDFELVNLSPTESPILSIEHNTDLEDLAPGFEAYYDSFDYGHSSTYHYMNEIDVLESKNFMFAKEKEGKYQHHRWDQLDKEHWMSSSSSESESIHSDSGMEYNQEHMPEIESSIEENSAFESKPYVASEFEPSSDLGMSDQVVLSESSAHSPAEEERSVARIIPEHEAVMPVLTDAESMLRVTSHDHEYETVERSVCWDSKASSTLVDLSEGATQNYDYMWDIDKLVSIEEKEGIGMEPSQPSPSSLVSETFQSSYDMTYHSSIHYLSSMMHFEALEFEKSLVMFKSESLIKSESKSPTAQSIS